MLDRLQHLTGGHVVLFAASFKAINIAAILIFHIGTLLSQSCAFLLPPLLGGKSFGISSDKSVVLLIQPQ
jgi:hypothetical protein